MRVWLVRLLPLAAVLALLAFPTSAPADPPPGTIVVGTATDSSGSCSLRAAIASANSHSAQGGCTTPPPSGTTTIELPANTYDVTAGELEISSDVNLVGAGARSTTIAGFASGERVLDVLSGTVTIGGVTIQGGSTTLAGPDPHTGLGGGIYLTFGATLTLQDSMVTQNEADTGGGGIFNDGTMTILRSTIEDNTTGSGGTGAGIENLLMLSMTNSTVMENQAQGDGGGLYLLGKTTLTNDTIAKNEGDTTGGGSLGGGGLTVDPSTNPSNISLTNTILAGNLWHGSANNCSTGVASGGGNLTSDATCGLGATELQNTDPQFGPVDTDGPTDTLLLTNTSPAIDAANALACPQTDQRNIARPQGAGCDIGASEFTNGPSDFYVSTADELDSAIHLQSLFETTATIHIAAGHYDIGILEGQESFGSSSGDNVTLAGAGAASTILDGDGLDSQVVDVGGFDTSTIKGVTVQNSDDTGIYDNGLLELDDSVVQSNPGVGIQDVNQGLTVSGSTISGNGSASAGVDTQFNGGIWSESGQLTVVNSTVTGNNGSGIYEDSSGLSLQDVTIADNPGVGLDLRGSGTAVSTIIGENTGGDCTNVADNWSSEHNNLDSDTSCNFVDPTDWPEVDPQLGPLQDNGGPTPTMAISSGSEAVDHGDNGNCLPVDQRGITRPQGAGCDIGAFELVGGRLSGTSVQAVVKPVEVTAAGDSDWALWSYNSSAVPASLTPNETKAGGGRQISDLSVVNGDGTPTRGFGGFPDSSVPYDFSWTDGTPDAAITAGNTGITAPKAGQGLSFTVPADTSPRRLTIWTSAHFADGTLTAHLSDGSAPDFVQTVHANAGAPFPTENVPTTFTLDYAAASDGQQLTVTWTESADNGCAPSCDDVVLYGAALSAGLSNLTVNAAPSNAGAGIDQVPINAIPNAWISFFAGSTNSAPVGSTPVGSTPVGSTPVGSTPVGSTPVGSTPVGSTPVGSTPVGSTPVGSTGLFNLPVGSTPVGSTALSSVLLSQVQLHGTTWDQVLCGSLLNKPLNAITLQDVKDSTETCSDGHTSLDHLRALTMNQVDLGTTLLRTVHWSSLLAGNTPLSSLPGGFAAWCGTDGFIPSAGGDCTTAGPSTTVLQMDVAGRLGSAPVGSTPVGSTPVGSTPVGSTPVGSTHIGASLLANIPLSDIANDDHDLSSVVDCSKVNCSTGTLGDAQTANAILPNVTFSAIKNAMAANNITINDLVVAIIGAAGFPWETLPIQGLQPYSATPSKVTYTIGNNVDCSLAPQYTITAQLPGGFFPVNGTAQFTVGNNPAQPAGAPTVDQKPNRYHWTVNCPAGDTSLEAVTLKFDAWVGLTLGTFQTHVTAATPIASISATGGPVTVHQNPAASDPSTANEIKPDTLVAGHIAFSGQQDFYKVKLTDSQGNPLPTGTRISAFLNVPSDADLDLTLSAPATPSFFSSPVGSTPVGSTPIEDSAVGLSSSGLALPPDTLQDVPVGSTPVGSTPVGSTPVGSTSANRGDGTNEAGAIITSGQSGFVTIGVSGYNGASSTKPFVLRVQETPPPPLPNCPARTFPNGAPSSFAAGALPSSLPTTTKTLFIVNKQRLTAMYGATAVTNLLNSLNTLAARSEVAGTVLFVDGDAGVRNAYSAWDAKPCDTTARNNVVRSINDVVASYRNSSSGLPSLHYIVLVGSDEAGPPMADAPDPVLLSPEENEANDLAFTTNGLTRGNALYASAAQNNILTDGAYGAFTSIPWLGRNLLLPQISISRLVETPSDIIGQISRYLQSSGYTGTPQSGVGTLNPTSALVTGYDFLADGAQAVQSNLRSNFPGLTPVAFASGNPAINLPGSPWKPMTHYNVGDIVHPTAGNPSNLTFQVQVAGTSGAIEPRWPISVAGLVPLDGGVTWNVIPPWTANDVLSAALTSASAPSIISANAHYNQYELESAAGDLANSGSASAALAARILFTMGCHGGLNIPDSLGSPTVPVNKYLDWPELYGRDQAAMYIANTGYGYGDTASVALSERLMALFAKNLHSDSGSVGEEWVNALQQYFATAGAYDVYDEKVMEETTFYGLPFWHFSTAGSSPTFTPLTTTPDPAAGGTQSATITFPGAGATTGTQFGLYRPNLPITSQQVTSNLPARGVWIKALTSNDTNTNATIGYPTIDLSAHEPAPNVSPIFFPASPFTLEHSMAFGQERDYLNVSDQFRPTGSGNAGTQRHFGSGTFEIFYSQSTDQLAPLISDVNVSSSGGQATVTARVTDDTGVAEVAALVNDSTSWRYLQLNQSSLDPTLWIGTITVATNPEVFVEATDGSNVSYSANKGENFTSTNSNTPPGGSQIFLKAPVGPYLQGQIVNATYQCSSAAQCVGTVPSGSPIDTSTFGLHTFVVTAYDADGNVVATLQRQYSVDYPFTGFFQPVDNLPALNVAKAGSAIPVKFSLGGNQGLNIFYNSTYPASQQIDCSSTAPLDTIETTVTAGSSSLSYDSTTGQYTYTWKTNTAWSGTCRALVIRTKFGSFHTADFKFK
jgi:hypothetical protein